jgi:FkbM family methyltransferase
MDDFITHIKQYIDISTISIIVDAGSLDGKDAILLGDAFQNTTIYAIEGLPDNYNTYIKNNPRIIGIQCVIASYDGKITYYQKDINGIHGIYNRGEQYGTRTLELDCYKMSTIMKQYNITKIDILKIDVEGATYDLLLSLEKHLEDIKILHIETETYPFFSGQTLHNKVCEYLIQHDFECLDITFVEIINNQYQSDSIWVNKKYKKPVGDKC